ncbi:sensor histidine kinase [Cohnella herbarum]|uniref:histidine kinase n=1 Tax=Cohnella herbarum TaxID=2728023 RepID=A0A7Z2ZPI8_9BACL|nr:sensor histidine kinase [Cohnella herbarum]QJD87214.1 HAMP domain-containing histidine kinase [Cohnella herbarum]
MVGILIGIVIALIALNIAQYRTGRKRERNLSYVCDKLRTIVEDGRSEKVLLFTDDRALKALLVELNGLLEKKDETFLKYARKETDIRKMLANISHDLRTPLTVVLGLTETILRDGKMAEGERQQLLKNVHNKAAEILLIINKFFDLARLESGDKELQLIRVNMSEICKNNLLFFYNQIETAGLEAVIDVPEKPIYALGNVEALDRILHNLISNAIRYGSDGMTVGLALREDERFVYVDVWDRGKGISETHGDRVFERMYTLEDSRIRLYQGSGLGLTITKRLVEHLDGEIALESRPFERTTFTVRLRRAGSFMRESEGGG